MAYKNRTSTSFIEASLQDNPLKWGFFQAVRNLDCFYYSKDKNYRRTGDSDTLEEEAVRFKQRPSLVFKDSEIDEYYVHSEENPASVYVNFFGLWGNNSPLPMVFTEYAFERNKHYEDNSLVNFMDIFHHRMLSLFYKAWAVNQQTVNADREDDDNFKKYLASIVGLSVFLTAKSESPVSLYSRLYFSGHMLYTPNISNLTAILSDYFKTTAEINPFMIEKASIPVEDSFCLGTKRESGMLGKNIVLGERFINCMMKFRVILGPMNLVKFMQMFPGKHAYYQLIGWLKYYIAGKFTFDIQLILDNTEIPVMSLGKTCYLGYTFWLRSSPEIPVDNRVVVNVREILKI